jgi:GTPase SAR1 family protein
MHVVLPLIFLAGFAVSVFLTRRLRRRTYRLAVLGARMSGKSTLIGSWRGEWLDSEEYQRTQTAQFHSKTKLTVEGLRLTFTHLADVAGSEHAWPVWEDQALESRYVLYLVDARILDNQPLWEGLDWHRLEDDAGQIGSWLKAGNAELCLLVVTHTDQDARRTRLGEHAYQDTVLEDLDPLVFLLGGTQCVRTVIGSLQTEGEATKVTAGIMREIIAWEKGKTAA